MYRVHPSIFRDPPPKSPRPPVITPERLRFFKLREAAARRQMLQHFRYTATLELIGHRVPVLPGRQALVGAVCVQQRRLTRLGVI